MFYKPLTYKRYPRYNSYQSSHIFEQKLVFVETLTNQPPGGGYLTRFWAGTCHRGFKHIPVPYTNFAKMYTRLYTNLSKIYTGLYTNFPKMHTQPYTNCENCENRYCSLYHNREHRYPSRWHVPVPKICIVAPPGISPAMRHMALPYSIDNHKEIW